MNNQSCRAIPLLGRRGQSILFLVICSLATGMNSPAKAAETASLSNINCLFNWAQTFYPQLFAPPVSGLQFTTLYTYRYYPNTDTYVGVSTANNHVYYLGPNDAAPRDLGHLSGWLAESGCGARPYPVIFIHGIASSAATWTSFRDYLIKSAGWTFGGIPTYQPATKNVAISCPSATDPLVACTGHAGDFYTLNFSDNQQLPFDIQGGELAAIIATVLAENPAAEKVLLVSHSMGGLAAREYLQGLARTADSVSTLPYWEDVAKLITVGTPHQGSFWAEACRDSITIFGVGLCDLLPLPIDADSAAVSDLTPNSAALNTLNDMPAHPLPTEVAYVSIIGIGQPTLVASGPPEFEAGDGIVSVISQDLAQITGSLPLQQKSIELTIAARACGNQIDVPLIGNVGETHTCETTDREVGREILRNLN